MDRLHNPDQMPLRYLPPGKVMDIYYLYQASCRQKNIPAASREHFRRCWKQWKDAALAFRKRSTHTVCTECFELKAKIKTARSSTHQIQAHLDYLLHLNPQLAVRRCYWGIRSRARLHHDVLSVITDGMDRSKFRLPRYPGGRTPKDSEKLHRPVLECTAVLSHGHGLHLFVCDEDVKIGSSWAAHCVLSAIDGIRDRLAKQGKRWPPHFHLQGDNTPKELKNSIMMKAVGCLTQQRLFLTSGVEFLRVGHTHEDVGCCNAYAIIKRRGSHNFHVAVMYPSCLQCVSRRVSCFVSLCLPTLPHIRSPIVSLNDLSHLCFTYASHTCLTCLPMLSPVTSPTQQI